MVEMGSLRPMPAEQHARFSRFMDNHPKDFNDLWSLFNWRIRDLPDGCFPALETISEIAAPTGLRVFHDLSEEFLKSHYQRLRTFCEEKGIAGVALLHAYGEHVFNAYDQFQEIEDQHGTECLVLAARQGNAAFGVVEGRKALLTQLKQVMVAQDVKDGFALSLLSLGADVLERDPVEVCSLAALNPAYFPRAALHLQARFFDQFPDLLEDIFRYTFGGASSAVRALADLSPDQVDLARKIVYHTGPFAGSSLIIPGRTLHGRDQSRYEGLIEEYGHAWWGLAQPFGEELFEQEEARRDFIQTARKHTGIGSGMFFYYTPEVEWNGTALEHAEFYGPAAGYIRRQLGEEYSRVHDDPTYLGLRSQNRTHFGLQWFNRYTRLCGKEYDVDLLENNLENLSADNRSDRRVALVVLSKCDLLNAFGSKKLFRLLKRLAETHKLIIFEADTKKEVDEIIRERSIQCDPRTLDLCMLAAHGNSFGAQWSGSRLVLPATEEEATYSIDNYTSVRDREMVRGWRHRFTNGGLCFLFSCGTFSQADESGEYGEMFEQELVDVRVQGMRHVGSLKGHDISDDGDRVVITCYEAVGIGTPESV